MNLISFELMFDLMEKFDVDENEFDERIGQVKDLKVMKEIQLLFQSTTIHRKPSGPDRTI